MMIPTATQKTADKLSMNIPFTKMHGLGNDFVVIDLVSQPNSLNPEQIRQFSDRQFGIGFDQLLQIEAAQGPEADFRYRIFNRDGSEVEHCGNGARCFAKYVHDKGLTSKNPVKVETINRLLSLSLTPTGEVSVDMGSPDFSPASLPFRAEHAQASYTREITLDENLTATQIEFGAVSMGNPHTVIRVDDVQTADVEGIGTALGAHADFPQGVNVGFMQIIDRGSIRLRVFERGAGETLACGTGACAAVAVGQQQGLLDSTVEVEVRGGKLTIEWTGNSNSMVMTGPATTVFEGCITL